MGSNHFDPKRGLIDFHNSYPMHQSNRLEGPALFHFVDRPAQREEHFFGIGDDRNDEMRQRYLAGVRRPDAELTQLSIRGISEQLAAIRQELQS